MSKSGRVAIIAVAVQHGSVPDRFSKTRARRVLLGSPLLLKKIHVRAEIADLHPALTGLSAHCPHDRQTATGVRENPDDLRPPLDLLVPTLKHVRRTHPKMVLPRKPQERELLLDQSQSFGCDFCHFDSHAA